MQVVYIVKSKLVTSLVEDNLNRNVMNFGSGFSFGPVQYYLIYT